MSCNLEASLSFPATYQQVDIIVMTIKLLHFVNDNIAIE